MQLVVRGVINNTITLLLSTRNGTATGMVLTPYLANPHAEKHSTCIKLCLSGWSHMELISPCLFYHEFSVHRHIKIQVTK